MSAGNPCSYRSGGQTHILRINDDNRVCLGTSICAGNINIRSANNNVETSGSGTSRRIVRLSPTPAAAPAAPTPTPAPEPAEPPRASSCGLGGTVSAGNSCTYEVGGQTFTLRMNGTTVCFAFFCAGANLRIVSSTINGVTLTMVTEGSGTSRRIAQISSNLVAGATSTSAPAATQVVHASDDAQDSNHLAIGIWRRASANAVGGYEFGAFVDGGDPFRQANLAGLTGAATYTGDATAVYSHRETDGNYLVDADVTLTARFGDASSLGSIDGTVSNITGEGPEPGWFDGVGISLGSASIGSAYSGFFTGAASSSGTDSGFAGEWSGRFYGNGAAGDRPGFVAGTFDAATADGGEAFVGAFSAQR